MKINQSIIFLLLISISYCSKKIFNLTENEFIEYSKATKDTKNKWLMIFYTNEYHDYDKFMDLLKKDISKVYKKDENVKFGFILINKSNAKWITNLLNINSIPFLILVSDGRLYYFKYDTLNVENILNFIDGKKDLKDSFPVPDKITVFTKGKILFDMLMNDLTDNCQEILDKFNINFEWNRNLTMILFGICTFIFFVIEIYFIKSCCMKNIPYDDYENLKKEKDNNKKEVKKINHKKKVE